MMLYIVQCHHEQEGKDWLTIHNGVVKAHPYCGKCGTVKNISSDRGRRIGYFMKSLSDLRKKLREKGHKVSEAQIRLISNELANIEEFEDTWWVPFSRQKEIYVSVVRKYLRVKKETIEATL